MLLRGVGRSGAVLYAEAARAVQGLLIVAGEAPVQSLRVGCRATKGLETKGHDAPRGRSDPLVLAEPARKEQVERRWEVQCFGGQSSERVVPRFVGPKGGDDRG